MSMRRAPRKLPAAVAKLKTATTQRPDGTYATKTRFFMQAALRSTQTNKATLAAEEETPPEPATDEPEASPEYLDARFRFLSAVLIEDRALDFSDAKVLKAGTKLWAPQPDVWGKPRNLTVYKDHVVSVDSWCGQVLDAEFVAAKGNVPAGVEGTIRLDRVADPRICRGLETGAIRSVSSGVVFAWKPSHPEMSPDDFWWHLGEEKGGKLVCMVVVELLEVFEISVVWEGADAWAKELGNELAAERFARGPEERTMKELERIVAELAAKAGLSVEMDGLTEENVVERVAAALKAQKSSAEQAATAALKTETAKAGELQAKVAELEAKAQKLSAQAELGSAYLEEVRQDAMRLYALANDGKTSEAILGVLKGASLETAKAFRQEYQAAAEAKAPLRCESCGSTKVSRASAQGADVPPPDSVDSGSRPTFQRSAGSAGLHD